MKVKVVKFASSKLNEEQSTGLNDLTEWLKSAKDTDPKDKYGNGVVNDDGSEISFIRFKGLPDYSFLQYKKSGDNIELSINAPMCTSSKFYKIPDFTSEKGLKELERVFLRFTNYRG